jgi:3',5'-cyclic AMP phosphodiesterase CpdA
MRIAHLSDPHFGAHDDAVAAAVPEMLRSLKVTAVVVSGDFTMSGRKAEYARACEWLSSLPTPRLIVPGNHDIPKHNQPYHRFFAPFRRFREQLADDLNPVLDLPEARIVGLNSSRPYGWYLDWSRGRLNEQQLQRLVEAFDGVPEKHLRIAVFHHPTIALPENRRALICPLEEIKAALAAARIDVVMGGHFHQSYLMELPGMEQRPWQTVASQVSTVTSTRLQGEPQGFHVLEYGGDELAGERYTWDGERFVHSDTVRFHRSIRTGWTRMVAA